MGFLDKVKSTVGDVSETVSKKIDSEKYDLKIRDEQKRIDRASLEIGKIVSDLLLNGEAFDRELIKDQYSVIVEANRRIAEFRSMKEEITGKKEPSKENVTVYEVENCDSIPEPEKMDALPPAGPVIEEEIADVPAEAETIEEEKVEAPADTEPEAETKSNNDFMKKLVPSKEVNRAVDEPIAEPQSEPAVEEPAVAEATEPAVEIKVEQSAPAVNEPAVRNEGGYTLNDFKMEKPASRVDVPEEGSMLSRIQSYRSSNYQGKKL